jgi:GTP cyclohydrolase II
MMNKMGQHADNRPYVSVPTPFGTLRVVVADVNGQSLLVAMSPMIPEVPIVRFQSSCVFGEAFHAIDCDCGAQLDAVVKLIGTEGGILIYTWEEGRGTGIVDKLRAIYLQQSQGLSTAEAFKALGHEPEPRTFASQIAALKQVFNGSRIRLASDNPRKIAALEEAGYTVERVRLDVAMTPERSAYLAHKREHLGHLDDD